MSWFLSFHQLQPSSIQEVMIRKQKTHRLPFVGLIFIRSRKDGSGPLVSTFQRSIAATMYSNMVATATCWGFFGLVFASLLTHDAMSIRVKVMLKQG